MRWSCPHCGVNLAVADEKLGVGWSFSRCYKCGGFALIRKSEVNLIKVDRAPAGENVVLPEASEEPMLSHEAMQNLNKYAPKKETAAPVIRPAAARKTNERTPFSAAPGPTSLPSSIANPPTSPVAAPAREPALNASSPQANAGTGNDLLKNFLPEPLPEISNQPKKTNLLPFAIGGASFMALGSGIYLFVQGQALWGKARVTAVSGLKERGTKLASNNNSTPNADVIQAPSLASKGGISGSKPRMPGEVADQVHHQAMAPIRVQEPAPVSAAPAPNPAAIENTAPLSAPPVTAAAPAAPAPSAILQTDQVKPVQVLVVQPKTKNANLHAGPGSLYPMLGVANPQLRYVVADWSDRWFKVVIPGGDPKAASNNPTMAWVRTDSVKIVPAKDTDQLQTHP